MTEGLAVLSEALLEAAYRAEFVAPQPEPETRFQLEGRSLTAGELRSLAVVDLATRIEQHTLLRRADDTARLTALRFVERRLNEANKIGAFDQSGSFQGFLRRVLSNLLLAGDAMRGPARERGRWEVPGSRAAEPPARPSASASDDSLTRALA